MPLSLRRSLRVVFVLGLAAGVLAALAAAIDVRRFPVGELARKVPHRTALMKQRIAQAQERGRRYSIDQRWVSYGRVSPLLRRAILVAEDDAFFHHGGLDWSELQSSARKNLEKRRVVRGGSTITQQLAKNLYLGDRRTIMRKLREVFLALRMERALSKRRIFEIYLNVIEWGDGIYGAEAAARRYFHVPAATLNERQALLLAAIIINPRRYSPLHPDRRIERRVRMIASRLRRRGHLDENQYRAAVGEPAKEPFESWFFGPPADTTAAPADTAADSGPEESTETTPGVPVDTLTP